MQLEALTFNLNAFKPEVQSCGTLNPRAKAILMKPSFNRTAEELAFLQRFTLKLKCFDRYPVYVRKELASVLYYEAFEKGRVVIRQGDTGFNFYFIASGSVLVEVQEEDQLTEKPFVCIMYIHIHVNHRIITKCGDYSKYVCHTDGFFHMIKV